MPNLDGGQTRAMGRRLRKISDERAKTGLVGRLTYQTPPSIRSSVRWLRPSKCKPLACPWNRISECSSSDNSPMRSVADLNSSGSEGGVGTPLRVGTDEKES